MTDIPPQNQDQQQNAPAPEQQQEQQWAAHPSWSGVLEMFPEGAQRDALLAQIRESDRNSQKAIEQARANQAPEEWRELIRLSQENEVAPEDLIESYNSVDQMREAIAEDPDAWLSSMKDEIDEAVRQGQITRKEGAALKRDATQQAATGGDDPAPLEDPAIAELRQGLEQERRWREQQEQQAREAQEAEQERQAEQASQAAVNQFIEAFETTFNAEPALQGVEDETRYIVANHALTLLQQNENLSPEQASKQAIEQFQTRFGLPKAPAAGAPVPIGGNNGSMQQPATAPGKGALGGIDKAREQAMIEALRQAQGAGIS